MAEWISTQTIEPADLEGTVSGRFGAWVCFVAYSRWLGWQMVTGSSLEQIAEPPLLFLEPTWAAKHPRKSPTVHRENSRLRRRKTEQLMLGL